MYIIYTLEFCNSQTSMYIKLATINKTLCRCLPDCKVSILTESYSCCSISYDLAVTTHTTGFQALLLQCWSSNEKGWWYQL